MKHLRWSKLTIWRAQALVRGQRRHGKPGDSRANLALPPHIGLQAALLMLTSIKIPCACFSDTHRTMRIQACKLAM